MWRSLDPTDERRYAIVMDTAELTMDHTKSQDADKVRKFKVRTRMWVAGGVLLAVG